MARNGRAGASGATLHVLLSISLVTFAFPYVSATVMAFLRPVELPVSASLPDVSGCLGDRKFIFLFCSVLLVLIAGESRLVASSGSGNAGFVDEIISEGGDFWRAPHTLDAESDAVDGGAGLPDIASPVSVAAGGGDQERAEEKELGMEETEEEEEERKQEQEEEVEEHEEVEGDEFRRKCDDFINKFKRERVMEALHLV